jgi:hypothetical protein
VGGIEDGHDQRENPLSRTTTVQIGGAPGERTAANAGKSGSCGNQFRRVNSRVREQVEHERFQRLRAVLGHAFAAPESSCRRLTAAEVIVRNRIDAD